MFIFQGVCVFSLTLLKCVHPNHYVFVFVTEPCVFSYDAVRH